MRVAVGSDHAGFELKRDLAGYLAQQGHEVIDLGTHSTAPVDYPDTAEAVATAVRNGQADRGLLICGSGAGVSVAASKFPGIRAAVCHDTYSARQAVEHDDLNVLCLGARVIGPALARVLSDAFLGATFKSEERYLRRLAKIDAIEGRFLRDE
ncbi:MAG: ribose 5-phosphate isomerase B [Acidobacteria bacterium]|nr:ribose 5-phosphate isomerase B [Acidobacteriota bacterium]HQZ38675.1 ribose 5-phosphate isomerase B [Vicinamibacterales bacterium]